MKVLWLASWYPNKISPLDGDFVQRHAEAVSAFASVDVIYVAQYGIHLPNPRPEMEETMHGQVRERRVYFASFRTGIAILDKLLYNWKYFRTYMATLREYFAAHGLPDLIHVHVPMKAGLLARWIKMKWGIPYLVTEHAGTYVPGPPDEFSKRSFYFRWNTKSIFQHASAFTSVSLHNGQVIKNLFKLKSLHVIHNVVDECFYYNPDLNSNQFTFIHVSTMGYNKNITGILNVCSKLKLQRQDWKLELIGPPNDIIADSVRENGLEDFVTIAGEMSNKDVAKRMQSASALVMFSRSENFPCAIIEALSCGLTVVSSNVAGIPEAVDASNGVLVSSEDEDQLLVAMNAVIDQKDMFNKKEIARHAIQKYSYKQIGKQFMDVYQSVLPSFK